MQIRQIPALLMLTVLALPLATGASAAVSAEQKCESGKLKTAASYASCLQSAYGKAVKAGSTDKLATGLERCEERFDKKWDKLEVKAVDAGTACVTTDDATAIKAGAEAHAACVASTLASPDSAACLRGPTSSPMEEAWNGLVDAIVEAGEWTKNHPFYDTELDRAEGMRRLLRTLIVALEDGMDDKGFPYFARRVDLLKRGALDNPDNTYYFARISDDQDYRITGTRGTTADLVFQSLAGYPGIGTSGPSDGIDILDAADMDIAGDGSFEILVSRDDPGTGNWLRIEEGAETILVRYTHDDWSAEEAGTVHITQVGNEGAMTALPTEARVAEMINRAAQWMVDTTKFWPTLVSEKFKPLPVNFPLGPLLTANGLDTQWNYATHFDLDPSEALVVTMPTTAARYQGIQIGSNWMESFEYAHRQTSLSAGQSDLGSDGVYRYVISQSDPGVPNWLDTEGHDNGILFIRFQGIGTPPAGVTATVVPLADVLNEFPGDVPILDAAGRAAQIAARQEHIQQRYNQ